VAGRFDAGIHLGEFIERDMIAARVSRDQRAAIVASLRYFESHPRPKSPRDLPNHRCINICMESGGVYRWEFDQGSKSLVRRRQRAADPRRHRHDDRRRRLTVSASRSRWRITLRRTSQAGRWSESSKIGPPFAGFFLYHPSRRQQPAALTALINAFRFEDRRK
jgi:DNA-binding transcriptional LysR family regulator